MKLRRLFYDSSLNFRKISISKVVLAIVIGISSAIVIYSFFYNLREFFRFMSFGFGNIPLIVSENNRNFYNLFFSGLSVVFGNSIALNFIFSKPQRITHRFNSKRKRLLNDNIFLSFNFSYWFVKIGLVFGIFSMNFMDFEFIPYFWFISILLLLVLYLESFKSLGQLLNNSQRLKIGFLNFFILLLLTFSLSKWNVVDYKNLDKIMLENRPIMDFPYSIFYNDDESRYRNSIELRLKMEDDNEVYIYAIERKWSLEDVPSIIARERASIREELVPFLIVNIVADKNIKINKIKELELKLYSVNQRLISYSVRTDDLLNLRFERKVITKKITPLILNLRDNLNKISYPETLYNNTNLLLNIVKIEVGSKILFEGNEVKNSKELVNKFIETISNTTAFEYEYSEDATYQDYINVLSAHFLAVKKLRKDQQTIFKNYKFERNEFYDVEQKQLQELFPIIIFEKFN